MAMQVGLVKFADGTLLYPVVIGSTGGVSIRLYTTVESARDHRRADHSELYPDLPEQIPDDEPVEVWESIDSADKPADFHSTASKSLRLLTGYTSAEYAAADYVIESGFCVR